MYDQTFGTDWDRIDDRDEIVFRAYAIGVATGLGEPWPDELEELLTQVETAYDRSFVLLAFRNGRDEAASADTDDEEKVWDQLVEAKDGIDPLEWDETAETEWDEADPLEETTLPDALEPFDVDSLPPDSTAAVRRPSFLERESGSSPVGGSDRSVFGRPVDDLGDRSDSSDGVSGDVADPDAASARDGSADGSPGDADGPADSSSGGRADSSADSDSRRERTSNGDSRARDGPPEDDRSSDR